MINILINPECPEIIFSLASLWTKLHKSYPEEKIELFSFTPDNFCKTVDELRIENAENNELARSFSSLAKTLQEIVIMSAGSLSLDFVEEDYSDQKYILLGIYPQNKKEADDLFNFFDRYCENVSLWVDWHEWPQKKLAEYFYSQNEQVIIDSNWLALDLIEANYKTATRSWWLGERAMRNRDFNNELAQRYLHSFLFARSVGQYFGLDDWCAQEIIKIGVAELLSNFESPTLSAFAWRHEEMIKNTILASNRISDRNPIFAEAKKMHRPVGNIFLDDVVGIIDLEEIMKIGRKRFPWLFIVQYTVNDHVMIRLSSVKMPIRDLLVNYCGVQPERIEEKDFYIANKVIIGYHESDLVEKTY